MSVVSNILYMYMDHIWNMEYSCTDCHIKLQCAINIQYKKHFLSNFSLLPNITEISTVA